MITWSLMTSAFLQNECYMTPPLNVKGQVSKLHCMHDLKICTVTNYEFGGTYGVQILDTADPLYKYKMVKSYINSQGIEYVGSSYCTWQDATKWLE